MAIEHLPALLRVGVRLTKSRADAEDLAQDTLVRALEQRASLRDEARLRAWLLSVQRTVHLNSRRGLRQRLEVLDGGLAAKDAPPRADLEAEVLAKGVDDELLAALGGLPEAWRDALWLREVEELSYDEIAEVQGCPVGTVRSRLARAREALAERLGEAKEPEVRDGSVQR